MNVRTIGGAGAALGGLLLGAMLIGGVWRQSHPVTHPRFWAPAAGGVALGYHLGGVRSLAYAAAPVVAVRALDAYQDATAPPQAGIQPAGGE